MFINNWYAACIGAELGETPRKIRLLDCELVLFRDRSGTAHCLSRDRDGWHVGILSRRKDVNYVRMAENYNDPNTSPDRGLVMAFDVVGMVSRNTNRQPGCTQIFMLLPSARDVTRVA